MLPRSARLLARSTPPPPAALRLVSSAAGASLLPRRLAPSASSAPPAGPSTTLAAGKRPFATSPAARSAKRDWENQAAGTKGAAKEETAEEAERSAAASSPPSADDRPPSDQLNESKAEGALDKAAEALKPDESISPAAVHEGVLPSSTGEPASAEASSSSSSADPAAPAEATTTTSTSSAAESSSSSSSSSSLSDASSSSTAPSSSSSSSGTAAKLASKARQKVRRASKAASSSVAASDADVNASESHNGEVRDLPSYGHTLVLPVTSSMLPPYRKNFTFTEPSVIRAVRSLASARIDQLGVFLLRPTPSSSTQSAAAEANPKVENVDVIKSSNEVYSTGLLCRIKSSRPGTVTRQDDGTELVSSWNVELEPVRRIVLGEVEVGRDAPESEGRPVTVEGSEGETSASAPAAGRSSAVEDVEEDGEGDVASFEKVDSKADVEVAAPADPLELLRKHAVSIGAITHVAEPSADESSSEIKELKSLYIQDLKDWAGKSPQDVQSAILELSHASGGTDFFHRKLADQLDIVAGLAPHATNADRQAVLDATDLAARLRAVLFIMKKELYDIEVRNKIHREMKQRLDERQKEMILGEQMRAIKKELGHDKGNGKDELVDKFRQQAEGLRMPEEVTKTFEAEMSKLAMLDQNSSEFNVVRNYLDWIVSVPWGKRTVDSFSIPSSIKILNEDHYGLTDVKDRILEFLAVGKLRGTVEGKILCLVGPPGVGKTSIAKSIARALDRRFYRISVGGLRDVAEIKGHRRTYVAAMPGKAVQALKQTQAENPLILIDEIDKMSGGAGGGGGSWGGDPSSALLEMLDPEQNGAFTDHYLDLPVDLSKVLFVCTANMLSTIPAPLLDRMEVLEVSGYVSEEKRAIAKGYLAPQAKKSSGLEKADVEVDDSAVTALIQYYCRESGVRNLKKHIEKIYRKAAFKIVKELSPEGLDPAVAGAEHPVVEVIEPTEADTAGPSAAQGAVPEPAVSTKTAEKEATDTATSAAADASTKVPAGSTTLQVVKPLEVPASVSMRITKDNLKDYVGPPVYQKDRIYPFAPPPGVSNGLGYTGNGAGALMPIEITVMPGKGSIQTTGKLGEVIKESVNIAISYLRANAFALGIAVNEGDIVLGGSSDRDIHLHMPEGAIGKDGPSAGVAILTALVSLMTKTRVDPDIAMTGEISLGGQVLPVGGLKEKILAAHRANIKKLIVPQACQGDIEENVHASVKDGIDIVYVSNVREVLYEVFGELPVAESWKDKYPLLELYGAADGPAPTSPSSTLNAS